MSPFKQCLIEYIERNFHVSFALFSLVVLTYHYSGVPIDWSYGAFAGLGTLVAYTYIRNVPPQVSLIDGVKRVLKQSPFWIHVLALLLLGLISGLNQQQGLLLFVIMLLCLGYILPGPKLNPKLEVAKKSRHLPSPLRDFGAIKIIIVALVWSGMSVLMPLLSDTSLSPKVLWLFVAQALWVVVLIIPFEIRDIGKDQLRHPTWPQKLGLLGVKLLGSLLLMISVFIHFWLNNEPSPSTEVPIGFMGAPYLITMILTAIGLLKATPKQSFWYSTFWIEALPIAWLILYYGFNFWIQ